jgi:MarR family 2-MHQ and catechol resistance regulon transcriptional repressor
MPTHYKGTAKEKRALDTFIKLTRAANTVDAKLSQGAALDKLTSSQFGTLETLYHLGPLCPGEIAQKLLKSGGNMTLVIDNLEKNGWVRRERSQEDRRQIKIHLTKAGQALIEAVLPQQVAAIAEVFNVLSPTEQQQLGELLRKLGKGNSG